MQRIIEIFNNLLDQSKDDVWQSLQNVSVLCLLQRSNNNFIIILHINTCTHGCTCTEGYATCKDWSLQLVVEYKQFIFTFLEVDYYSSSRFACFSMAFLQLDAATASTLHSFCFNTKVYTYYTLLLGACIFGEIRRNNDCADSHDHPEGK